MKNFIFLIFVLLVVLVVLEFSNAGTIAGKYYCSPRQVQLVIAATCAAKNKLNQKRAFFANSDVLDRSDRNLLWRKLFNLNDNTTVTIPEASFQLNLLFGRCDEEQREIELKNLLEMYQKSQDYLNDRLMNNNLLNYDGSNYDQVNAYESLIGYRKKSDGISDECCSKACSLSQIMEYCS